MLDTINVDKHIYSWVYSLCKYGDLYLRLYRQSEFVDPIFGEQEEVKYPFEEEKDKSKLNEDIIIKAYSKTDKFVHYLEAVSNPAEVFELTRFGKTAGYIKADVGVSLTKNLNKDLQNSVYQYAFNKRDVEVYDATEFVHACLEDNSSRTPEEVKLFITDDTEAQTAGYTYKVRRGQSLLYSVFKIWRELMLLENSILLNRVTKSSIVRIIGVEVGDMPKESVGPHLQGVKSLIEQKVAINNGQYMSEYTNPGPVENNIYVPTRNGIGAITTQQVGGDVDVKSLADLDYFKNKFFGGLRVPKQYFGDTDDSTGFNGGTSLSIISSRYAKMIKRIQNTMVQAITDAINIMLIDKGLNSYINKFQIHMLPPTTQEEIDRQAALSSEMQMVNDVMNNLTDVENVATRLKIVKAMLSNILTDNEVIDLIQEQIDELEEEGEVTDENTDVADIDAESANDESAPFSPRSTPPTPPSGEGNEEAEAEVSVEEPAEEGGTENLPSPTELGIDLTDNTVEI